MPILNIVFVCCITLLFTFLFQGSKSYAYPRVHCDFAVSHDDSFQPTTDPIEWQYHTPEEEIRLGLFHLDKIFPQSRKIDTQENE